MGRWLEVLGERPPAGADGFLERRPLVVVEIAPHPLLWAGRCFGREHRGHFPALEQVRESSPAYVDELLWLDGRQAGQLLREFRRVRRICRREEFLAGLDGRRYYDLWRRGEPPAEFEEWLGRIEQVLAVAEGDRWVLISL